MPSTKIACTDTFLGSGVELFVLFDVLIDLDQLGSCQQLHDHGGGDHRGDTELHQSTSIGGENDTHPIKWVATDGFVDTVERNLGAD